MDILKTKILSIVFVFIALVLVSSCSQELTDDQLSTMMFSKQYAREVTDDGWIYSVTYFFFNDGSVDNSIPPLTFTAINLRHRYPESVNIDDMDDGVLDGNGFYKADIQILGDGVSEETDRDMQKIADYLGYGGDNGTYPSVDEILSKNRGSLELEILDESLFFDLLDRAIDAEPKKVGKYINHPAYALLNEQQFVDDYEFQVGFILSMGNIDVLVIDILYRDESSSWGYVQLSDLLERGQATDEQKAIYAYINELETGIVSNNDFLFHPSHGIDSSNTDVDWERLFSFLSDIDENQIEAYIK